MTNPAAARQAIDERGPALVRWARSRMCEVLGGALATPPDAPWCGELAATFVTLRWRRNGELQGCIGTITPARRIVDDVASNALAAMRDSRGVALVLADLDELDISVSILSPLEEVARASEAEMIVAIRIGVDGGVLEDGEYRGVLLPSVWDSLRSHDMFLKVLKRKAGLPPEFWRDTTRLFKFSVERHVDPAPGRR